MLKNEVAGVYSCIASLVFLLAAAVLSDVEWIRRNVRIR